MTFSYTPSPFDTEGVELPASLEKLKERIAEHIHDTWARGRLRDGWSYGPRRDDENREHPGLVPYAELSEEEKEYDRRTAFEALRVIVAMGYEIVPPSERHHAD